MKVAVVTTASYIRNVIATDVRGGNRVSQISCILDNKFR